MITFVSLILPPHQNFQLACIAAVSFCFIEQVSERRNAPGVSKKLGEVLIFCTRSRFRFPCEFTNFQRAVRTKMRIFAYFDASDPENYFLCKHLCHYSRLFPHRHVIRNKQFIFMNLFFGLRLLYSGSKQNIVQQPQQLTLFA